MRCRGLCTASVVFFGACARQPRLLNPTGCTPPAKLLLVAAWRLRAPRATHRIEQGPASQRHLDNELPHVHQCSVAADQLCGLCQEAVSMKQSSCVHHCSARICRLCWGGASLKRSYDILRCSVAAASQKLLVAACTCRLVIRVPCSLSAAVRSSSRHGFGGFC